jgi:hypothetical protein
LAYSVGCVLDGGRRVLVLLGAEDLLHRIRRKPSESTGLFEETKKKKVSRRGLGIVGLRLLGDAGLGPILSRNVEIDRGRGNFRLVLRRLSS